MKRRSLLAAALGLTVAPMEALAAPVFPWVSGSILGAHGLNAGDIISFSERPGVYRITAVVNGPNARLDWEMCR